MAIDARGYVDTWISAVTGDKCWHVGAGGCTGSMFTLWYGAKVLSPAIVWNPAYSDEINRYEAEYSLFVQCSHWVLGIDRPDNSEIITDSDADCAVEGPMVQGLNRLIGSTVLQVTFDPHSSDLNIYFQDDMRLKVWGTVADEEDGYSLFLPGHIVTISGPERIVHEVQDS